MSAGAAVHWDLRPGADWPAVAPLWDRLNGDAGGLPFFAAAFVAPLLEHFGRGDEIVAIARRGDRPVAGAILAPAGRGRVATFQPAQMPLGPWLVANGENGIELADALLRRLPGLTLGLGLSQVDPLLQPRPGRTARVDTLDYIETGWVDVAGSFDTYWEARGKNLRTNMRKQRSKLEGEGVGLHFETLTDPGDVPAAIAEYGRLESAGWKGEMGTSIAPDNVQGRFYTAMLRNFCALGRGRIWQLRFGDKVVAMDLCIESDDTLVVLKTTFDPEYRNVSPAFLMRQEAFRQVFDAGRLRRIEFYGRMMEWHTRWTEQSRTLYHVNVYRWALVPRLRQLFAGRPTAKAPAAGEAAGAVPGA
jgi:CelD/BcsL family acetyltransferase involved in cellulose biosynthesis